MFWASCEPHCQPDFGGPDDPSSTFRCSRRAAVPGPPPRVGPPAPGPPQPPPATGPTSRPHLPSAPRPSRPGRRLGHARWTRAAPAPPAGLPVHQPGVVPLRPLTLGDIFGGALKTVRHNPKATVGVAAIVTFGFMLIPMLATVLLGALGEVPAFDIYAEDSAEADPGDVALIVSSMASGVFSVLASIVVTGLIVRVVEAGSGGAMNMAAGEAWRAAGAGCSPAGPDHVLFWSRPWSSGAPSASCRRWAARRRATPASPVRRPRRAPRPGGRSSSTPATCCSRPRTWSWRSAACSPRCPAPDSSPAATSGACFGIYLLANLTTSFVGQVIAIPFAILGVVLLFVLPDCWAFAGMLLTTLRRHGADRRALGPVHAGVLALQYYRPALPQGRAGHRAAQPDVRGPRRRTSSPLLACCSPTPDRAASGCGRSSPGGSTRSRSLERFARWFNELVDAIPGRRPARPGWSTRSLAARLLAGAS